MKTTFLILTLIFSNTLFAATEVRVSGRAWVSEYCNPNSGFCIRNAQERAERDAERDADNRCWVQQGRIVLGSMYCRSNCFPNYIPPGSNESTFVRCDADCEARCQLNR